VSRYYGKETGESISISSSTRILFMTYFGVGAAERGIALIWVGAVLGRWRGDR
jgi:hypothetical protein